MISRGSLYSLFCEHHLIESTDGQPIKYAQDSAFKSVSQPLSYALYVNSVHHA